MSVPDIAPSVGARDSRYWLVFLLRAVIAAVIALAVTFSADHSVAIGYLAFAAFAILSGLVVGVLGAFRLAPGTERSFFLVQGAVGVLAGVIALLASGAGVAFLLFLVGAWAVVSGVLEFYCGLRARRVRPEGRDWLFAGALTVVFAIAALLIPANYSEAFTGPDHVARVLTASVVLVGVLGAYAAILAVYLVISALSLKWGTQRAVAAVAEGGN